MFVFLPYRADDDEYAFERKPWLTWCILALCIAIYIAMAYGLSEQQIEHLYYEFGCVPSEFHWWTIFSCTLLHGSVGHLIGNMFFFFIYAPMCEKAFGHGRFLLLYLLGAAASMGGHLLMTPVFYRDIPCIGASGAISAVLGAFLVAFPTVRIKSVFVVLIFFPRPVVLSLPAWLVLGCWFLMQIFYSLNVFGGAVEVAFWAHVAGFAAGALIGSGYLWIDRWKQKLDITDCLRRLNTGIAVDPEDLRWLNANGYIDSALLEALTTTDDELAFVRLNTQLRLGRRARDDGKVILCYYRLLRRVPPEEINGDIHAAAMRSALSLRAAGIAGYAGFQALVRHDETAPLPGVILEALAEACELRGDDDGAGELRRFAAELS